MCICVCVCEFQISQLIRLLIRDKQTNPFKYQTVLIGASRTYGSVFGFSLWTQTQTTWFSAPPYACVCESIFHCRHAFDGFANQEQTHVQQIHTPTIRLQYEQLKRFISFIPFFSTFVFLTLFYCQFFRLPLVLLCFALLCCVIAPGLLFSYCSLKYYMPLCVAVAVVVVFKTCVHTVSQFLSDEQKKTHSHKHTNRTRSEWTKETRNARHILADSYQCGLWMQHGYCFLG